MAESKKGLELKVVDLGTIAKGKSATLDTKYGPVKYTIHGDTTKPAFLTYHDIGLNHESCFSAFFNMLFRSDPFFNQFCLVHIDAPGHEYDAADVAPDVSWFDMEELAEQVEQIADRLSIKSFYGFGAGAGATVLLHHAIKYPARPMGMMLLGASGRKCGWIEWVTKWQALAPFLVKSDAWWREWFIRRWFSWETITKNQDLTETYWRENDRINPNNAYKFTQGFQRRKDILQEIKNIECGVLLICGDRTPLENEATEILDNLNSKSDMMTEHETGMLVSVERPEALIKPLKLALLGMGYF